LIPTALVDVDAPVLPVLIHGDAGGLKVAARVFDAAANERLHSSVEYKHWLQKCIPHLVACHSFVIIEYLHGAKEQLYFVLPLESFSSLTYCLATD
jgi:hypothetical protein